MNGQTRISSLWIVAGLLAAFTFLTLAVSGCAWNSEIACVNAWTATLR